MYDDDRRRHCGLESHADAAATIQARNMELTRCNGQYADQPRPPRRMTFRERIVILRENLAYHAAQGAQRADRAIPNTLTAENERAKAEVRGEIATLLGIILEDQKYAD